MATEKTSRDACAPNKPVNPVGADGENAMVAFHQMAEPEMDDGKERESNHPNGHKDNLPQSKPPFTSELHNHDMSPVAQESPDRRENRTSRFRPTIDTVKGRFSNAHSGIVMPRRLGQTMNLATHIRFHSYGWNLNTRLEPTAFVAPAVCRLLTFQDLSFYSRIFFQVVDPVYHFLDQQRFVEQCAQYWTSENETPTDLGAVVCGVVALGSFFAESPAAVESSLIEHAKQILDIGCAYAPGRVSLTQIAGWILRTLYLRLTTRPHLSWFSSCSTMHIAEAMGLHVNLQDADLINKESGNAASEVTTSRADLLGCAVFLNMLISAEYGRSRVILQDATAEPTSPSRSKLMDLCDIMARLESTLTQEARTKIVTRLAGLPLEPPIFGLLKTDVTIHLFRRHLHSYQEKLNYDEAALLLSIIKAGLSAARVLIPQRQAWWNVLSTPFQSLMTLLAIDTDESLSMIEDTISVLSLVYNTFPAHLAGEVLQTAQLLIRGLEKRKIKQARMLSKACSDTQSTFDTPSCSNSSSGPAQAVDQAEAVFDNWLTGDVSWNWLATDSNVLQSGNVGANADMFGVG
ncbi:hypothetical protein PV08_05431 [Exophiala spinifera]|uniref:Xylanolytic transcriptional activator regulatory domain-containing protein n=1 Tax=Exophiala spinifera TaxID=91928 RepID=A0A0D2B9T2_9EURO|nr:uncharacterized protein PV08_05431 [Exophiala spinifera]KIW15385.1 hypothetical protein PV08_05431 [Exophiala spinifera]